MLAAGSRPAGAGRVAVLWMETNLGSLAGKGREAALSYFWDREVRKL